MKIVALAGGVGGAKLVDGLAKLLPPEDLSIIVNTGDDFDHLGLRICPDLDTVCYTLAGLSNPETGWGRSGDTWNCLAAIRELAGPDWFHLGDGDVGTHLVRTFRLGHGEPLSAIVSSFCVSWGIQVKVLPMTDERVSTQILTQDGNQLDFQEYFVRLLCQPAVKAIIFDGADSAEPAPGVLEAIDLADFIIFCPSNPWVSINPILSIPGIRERVIKKKVVAISPIIGGKTIKGPAAKMYQEFGITPSALAVARHYEGIIEGFIFDITDHDLKVDIERLVKKACATNTIMLDSDSRKKLAQEVLKFCLEL
ncbi:MAG: 2-phospho-L-lactate transferase [Anaerolineae bacterium]|nr:2-phospho-L-lactate transferase [Anaerolineae bacterium]